MDISNDLKKDKYIGCMVLHAVGDTVGFKNGEWEFKQGGLERTLEKFYEFLDLGGVNHISLKEWIVSDDTIMHIQTADSLLSDFTSLNQFGNIIKENYIEAYDQFIKEGEKKRFPGIATMKYLKQIKEGRSWEETPYDYLAGGSGASMKSLCIGLAFHGKENRHKLIQFSIESGRITHNSAVGYLGAVASALFTALAIEDEPINNWPFILLDLFNKNIIQKYIKASKRGETEYSKDSHVFIDKWQKYIEDKFDQNRNPIKRKINQNLIGRSKYYRDTFAFKFIKKPELIGDKPELVTSNFIGSGGDDSVIIAYDCLLDSGSNWEKLIIYSMLHIGDGDTTGAIAAGFHGALYGFQDISENYLEHLEYKKILFELGEKLYDKYYISKN